jgi:hypothetical protein
MRGRLLTITALLLARDAAAQAVRGRVVAPDSTQVPGAIVTLLDSAGTPLARALADDSGRFNMRMPAAGRFTFQVLRLGYRPTTAPAFSVEAGSVIDRMVVVTGAPISLRAVQVTAPQRCFGTDSANAAFTVWEEARTALIASQLTRMTRAYTMDVELFDSRQPAERLRAPVVKHDELLNARLRALTPVTPEQLARDGYLVRNPMGDRYFAPDEDVLLSESFATTHCMRLLPTDGSPDDLRLGFTPTPDRLQPEIRGILTVDRATSELRRLDFAYVNLRPDELAGDPGGEITFRRLPEGSWIIDYWALGLPFREDYVQTPALPSTIGRGGAVIPGRPAVIVTGIGRTIRGGGVTRIRFGDEIVWAAEKRPEPHPLVLLPAIP